MESKEYLELGGEVVDITAMFNVNTSILEGLLEELAVGG